FGELIGGGAPRRLRRFDLADQCASLLFEQARSIYEARALALGLFDARLQRLDLRGRAAVALAPGLPVGGDGREPARGNLRFARERLRFRAHLGQLRAPPLDLAARRSELRLDIGGRRQRFECTLRLLARGNCLVAACTQSRLGFRECREARSVAARLTLGLGMPVARGLRLLLQSPPARARRGFGLGRGGDLRLGRGEDLLLTLHLAAHGFDLSLDLGKTVLAGESAGSPGRGIGGDRKAVPTPEVAFPRDQALAPLERRGKTRGPAAPGQG